ncbi:MAG: hypothetical protein M3P85_00185 [Actinomycetota bacterium]|nr:hypothetical protein [Actinomycetota bacterium]
MGNYSIIFKGIYCDSEMTSDQASNSDEYYLITTVWADLGGNKVTSKTTKVPGGRSVFTDVDDGESRKTEVLLYSGPARKVVVGTQLYEEDFGDADATTQGIAKWAKAVEDLAEGTDFTLPEAVSDRIPEIVNYIFDFDDDMVDHYQTRLFMEKRLAQLAAAPAKQEFGVNYRFRTRHQGGGAHVVAYYDVLQG